MDVGPFRTPCDRDEYRLLSHIGMKGRADSQEVTGMQSIVRVLISGKRIVVFPLVVNYNDPELTTAPRCARTETRIRARSVQPS